MQQISYIAKRYLRDMAIASVTINVSSKLSFDQTPRDDIYKRDFGCLIKTLTLFAETTFLNWERVLYYRNISPQVFRGLKVFYFVCSFANLKQDMAENPESQEFADLWERNLM